MDKYASAITWLEWGADLLPCQPYSKHLVKGFGEYRQRITTPRGASHWFYNASRSNLAIVCPDDLLCLDFDDLAVYTRWDESLPVELAATYTEVTRRGFHVFFRCKVPAHIALSAGVEVKRVVMVAPSELSGFVYRPVDLAADIVTVDDWSTVFSFLVSADPLPEVKPVLARVATLAGVLQNDLVGRIKAVISVYDLAASLTQLTSSDGGHGRYWSGLCPFHDDHAPSFWVDTSKGLWGCYSCKSDRGQNLWGDVINLYARAHNVTDQEAIRNLAAEVLK